MRVTRVAIERVRVPAATPPARVRELVRTRVERELGGRAPHGTAAAVADAVTEAISRRR
jgi:hypothetical protein